MKHITKILAMGFALGLALAATTANATPGNPVACNKEWVGAKNKHCKDKITGTTVTVDADADATAIAAALANATATGGSASATGGSATASNGNQSISITEAKQRPVTGVVGLNLDVAEIMQAKPRNIVELGKAVHEVGNDCRALAVLNRSPSLFSWMDGSRLDISC